MADRQKREREKEERFLNIPQPKAWRRWPSDGWEGPGRWVGKAEGECHPIEQLFPRPLDI